MPGVGGLSIANNLLSNNIQLNLNKNQASLQHVTSQLSSGLRINGPADDPSGFSIATNLQTQVNSLDQASQNIQDANNAATVASGALSTVTSIRQQVRTLAVEASSNLLSASDRTNIQTEISQLVSEVNSVANNTQFNGLNLLDGSKAGYQAAVSAAVSITQNAALNSQNANLVSSMCNRVGRNERSIVAALIASSFSLTAKSSAMCPSRSIAYRSPGNAALRRLPHNLSAASHITRSASTTAISYTLFLEGFILPDFVTALSRRIACLR